jgi:NOL1/NOP2/sun family putative RNA methylase
MGKKPLIDGLPADFFARVQIQFPKQYKQILETFKQRPAVVRVNTLVTSLEEVQKLLISEGIEFSHIALLPNSLIITNADRRQLTDLEIYKEGHLYIQSIASQLAVAALDPQPGEKILDLCSAPGSKTTQIAIQMNKEGELLANDNNKTRMFRLIANLKHQHCDEFVEVKNYSGQNYPKFYPEQFDRILVDAPCSSEARFNTRYPKSINFWSRHKVKAMAKTQKRLLGAAIQCLKVGGAIVYSTCTLAPEENELVLKKILEKYPEVEIQELSWDIPQLEIVQEWNGKEIPDSIQNAIRLAPNESTEAFFICKIKKTNSNSRKSID